MNIKHTSLSSAAEFYAKNRHRETNHKYGDDPYEKHLGDVVSLLEERLERLHPDDRELAVASAWCHDLIEDARVTFSDLSKEVHPSVAEVVYSLTQEKGRNRKQRASPSYYQGIREQGDVAVMVKLMDRLANYRQSKSTGHRMSDVYSREMPSFLASLWDDRLSEGVRATILELADEAGVRDVFVPIAKRKSSRPVMWRSAMFYASALAGVAAAVAMTLGYDAGMWVTAGFWVGVSFCFSRGAKS